MDCETCKEQHEGNYGSGRFCCLKCARKFSTLTSRNEINEKISKSLTGKKHASKRSIVHLQSEEAIAKRKLSWENKRKFGPWENLKSKRLQRERLLFEQDGKCAKCSMEQWWNGAFLPFEMDHISGDRTDNSRTNVRMICPNCHRQTDTWGSKNASPEGRLRLSSTYNRNMVT